MIGGRKCAATSAATDPSRGSTGDEFEHDDTYVASPLGLDIDHRVPLGEAWESDAFAWSATEREVYANDLGDGPSLIAVTGSSNRAKVKKDPAEWQPPYAGNICAYDTDWVAVKARWGQYIDPVEKTALAEQLAHCPNVPVTVTLAR